MSAQAVFIAQKRTSQYWLNLVLAALVDFYLLFIGWQVAQKMLCAQIAVDFCQYWSVGKVASTYGYSHIYDLQFLAPVENSALPRIAPNPQVPLLPPVPYLAIFFLPVQLLSSLSPQVGYWLWTAVNILALFLYIRYFVRRLHLDPPSVHFMLTLLASLPVFMNLFLGQMEIWLLVCSGEFIVAMFGHRPFRAGLWLGGLLLKPAVLVFVALIFLVQHSIRLLAGLTVACFSLLAVSFLLTGPAGFGEMLKLWLVWGNGNVNIWVDNMMNWRMLGLQLSNLSAPSIGWSIAALGMFATLVIMLVTWRRPFNADSPSFPVAVVGMFAASLMLAWHSHIHMAVMLVPSLVYAYQRKILPQRLWDYWVFVPAVLYMTMVFVPETFMAIGVLPVSATSAIHGIIGAGEFSANLCLFVWAVRRSLQGSSALTEVTIDRLAGHSTTQAN